MKFSELKLGQKFKLAGDNRIYIKEVGPNNKNARMLGTRLYVLCLLGEIVAQID